MMKKIVLILMILSSLISAVSAQTILKFNKIKKLSSDDVPLSLEDKKSVITIDLAEKLVVVKVEGESTCEAKIVNVDFPKTNSGEPYILFGCVCPNGDEFGLVSMHDFDNIWIINEDMTVTWFFNKQISE